MVGAVTHIPLSHPRGLPLMPWGWACWGSTPEPAQPQGRTPGPNPGLQPDGRRPRRAWAARSAQAPVQPQSRRRPRLPARSKQPGARLRRAVCWTVCPSVCPQEDVYCATTQHLVEGVISGYNATVFAYGPSGTGGAASEAGMGCCPRWPLCTQLFPAAAPGGRRVGSLPPAPLQGRTAQRAE